MSGNGCRGCRAARERSDKVVFAARFDTVSCPVCWENFYVLPGERVVLADNGMCQIEKPCEACDGKGHTVTMQPIRGTEKQACGPVFHSPWDEQQTKEEHDNVE